MLPPVVGAAVVGAGAVPAPGAEAGAAVPVLGAGVGGAAGDAPVLGAAMGEGISNEYVGKVPSLYCRIISYVGISNLPPL